jgi:hypothetical protein
MLGLAIITLNVWLTESGKFEQNMVEFGHMHNKALQRTSNIKNNKKKIKSPLRALISFYTIDSD